MINYVIFDMDGLMLDSERYFVDYALELAKKMDIIVTREQVISTVGTHYKNAYDIFANLINDEEKTKEFMVNIRNELNEHHTKYPIEKKQGLVELLDFLKTNGIKMAVATSTIRERAIAMLKNAEIYDYFDYYITGNDVHHGKPNPEVFNIALDTANISNTNALVLEDSENGLLASVAANIRCIIIPDISIIKEEHLKKAYRVLPDLSKVINIIKQENDLSKS